MSSEDLKALQALPGFAPWRLRLATFTILNLFIGISLDDAGALRASRSRGSNPGNS